ncbi:hypothetical protein M885DRAFT_611476 [Pelagophyceae sp. CCMP2097]|nr:hypothetical protein M885DRAFT_611476 [Pelagophyceae sp. CCMP2097]
MHVLLRRAAPNAGRRWMAAVADGGAVQAGKAAALKIPQAPKKKSGVKPKAAKKAAANAAPEPPAAASKPAISEPAAAASTAAAALQPPPASLLAAWLCGDDGRAAHLSVVSSTPAAAHVEKAAALFDQIDAGPSVSFGVRKLPDAARRRLLETGSLLGIEGDEGEAAAERKLLHGARRRPAPKRGQGDFCFWFHEQKKRGPLKLYLARQSDGRSRGARGTLDFATADAAFEVFTKVESGETLDDLAGDVAAFQSQALPLMPGAAPEVYAALCVDGGGGHAPASALKRLFHNCAEKYAAEAAQAEAVDVGALRSASRPLYDQLRADDAAEFPFPTAAQPDDDDLRAVEEFDTFDSLPDGFRHDHRVLEARMRKHTHHRNASFTAEAVNG